MYDELFSGEGCCCLRAFVLRHVHYCCVLLRHGRPTPSWSHSNGGMTQRHPGPFHGGSSAGNCALWVQWPEACGVSGLVRC